MSSGAPADCIRVHVRCEIFPPADGRVRRDTNDYPRFGRVATAAARGDAGGDGAVARRRQRGEEGEAGGAASERVEHGGSGGAAGRVGLRRQEQGVLRHEASVGMALRGAHAEAMQQIL